MRKFALFSGFLGSGKTSTMISLADFYSKNIGSAAIITNDLGGPGLADRRYADHRGCTVSEITGDCICYQNEKLMEHLNRLFDAGNELIVSDIPGFGVGALEHVYHGLAEKFPGACELAPFTVLVEPETVSLLKDGYNEDAAYILNTQLVEADLIVLNKCDTMDAAERAGCESWLKENYPNAELVTISARTGENMAALAKALREGKASMRRPDIGYGGEAFTKIMEQVCEYNMQYYAEVCCETFDGSAYLCALAEEIRSAVKALGTEMPHMKLLGWTPEGDYAKADMMGTGRPVEMSTRFTAPCTQLAVVLNSSAFGGRTELDKAVSAAVEKVSDKFQLEISIFKRELI